MDKNEKEANVATKLKDLMGEVHPFGGQFCDYQADGVLWMMANLVNQRSSFRCCHG